MTTLSITFNQIHVLLDALTQHASRIGDDTYDPTGIYDGPTGGVFPATHPLRNLTKYAVLTDALVDTFTDALGAAGEESAITLVIEG